MKWIFLCYILVLIVVYVVVYILKNKNDLKKKRKHLSKKKQQEMLRKERIFLPVFALVNALFLGIMCIYYYFDYKSSKVILEENNKLLIKKDITLENINNYNLDLSDLEIAIVNLDSEIDSLEENKVSLSMEIDNLKEQYNSLYFININKALYQILNFPTYDQRSKYPNGCEAIALYLLLKFNGIEANPEDIVNMLKKGDSLYVENGVKYGGDPEIEFIGDPRSTSGYGVFENPIIDVANKYKSGIIKATGTNLTDILKIVESGKPVQVWATSYGRTPTKCNTWIHKVSGKTITWYCNFHSLVLIGATSNKVIVSDPLTGTIVNYDRANFEYAYDFYGRRAIYYE